MSRWDRTHESLRRAALELFAERGYAASTTAQIAVRAGVTEMTLFRHFPTKESLLLEDPFDPMLAESVRARPADEPVLRALVEGIRQAWQRVEADDAYALRVRLRFIAQTPGLNGAIERNSAATTAALVGALVHRGADELPARVAASAVIAGLSAALMGWARSEQSELTDVVDSALAVLGGE